MKHGIGKKAGRMLNVFAIALIVVGILTAWQATPVAAQRERTNCEGVAGWYADVSDLKQQVSDIETQAAGSGQATNPDAYRQMASALNPVAVPTAADATEMLVDGYGMLADFVESSNAANPMTASFDGYVSSITQLSNARHQILNGYLGWSQLGASCGFVTDFQLDGERGCEGVADYLSKAEAVYRSWWSYWEASLNDQKRRVWNGQSGDWSQNVSPAEDLMNYAYLHAFDLATTPASEEMLAIQQGVVENFMMMSDMYALNVLGALGALNGTDQSGLEPITQQFGQLSAQSSDQQSAISESWNELSSSCGVGSQFPQLPGSR